MNMGTWFHTAYGIVVTLDVRGSMGENAKASQELLIRKLMG
jgi:hypothetical protein